jgi:hypothetical protein
MIFSSGYQFCKENAHSYGDGEIIPIPYFNIFDIILNNVKTYQFKHSVKDDQIIRQKLQISIFLIFEMVLHVIWNGASVDAK